MITPDELYPIFLNSTGISIDSRKITPGSLFFALKGDNFDGNSFAQTALDNGAGYAVVDNPEFVVNERFILVNNALRALQDLASFHRKNRSAIVLGITGSNGKTTTKELIGRVLSSTYSTIVTPGNLNNHIGVPLTLLSIEESTKFAIVEMGANHRGEIAGLCNIARPDFGIITNIGKAHLEGFGGFEGVIKAKSELYDFIRENKGLAFVNLDNPLLSKLSAGMNVFSYGTGDLVACKGEISGRDPYLSLEWSSVNLSGSINTNLYGEYNFENILAAIAIGVYFNVDPLRIDEAIRSYYPDNNRSQLIKTAKNTLVLDAYNANPSSMKAAILNFASSVKGDKMIILGDMMELGEESAQEHKSIVKLVRDLGLDDRIFIGGNFAQVIDNPGEICFPTIAQAELWLKNSPVEGKTILLKGSRKMHLESMINLL